MGVQRSSFAVTSFGHLDGLLCRSAAGLRRFMHVRQGGFQGLFILARRRFEGGAQAVLHHRFGRDSNSLLGLLPIDGQ